MNPIDIAWFAGIFEADGHGKVNRSGGTICVTMIDKECIDRMSSLLGIGNVYGPYGPTKAGNPTWRFQITDRKELARICLGIYPLLGPKKGAQIAKISEYLYDHLPHPQKCENCKEDFVANTFRGTASRTKYCSTSCLHKAFRKRKKERLSQLKISEQLEE